MSFPSNLTLASILDKHRARPDAVLTSVFYEPTESVKDSEEKLLVATDKETDELLLIEPLETLEEDFSVRMSLLESHPSLSLSTRLLDAHVYVFRRTVLDLLATRRGRDLSSVREQFVPWLVKGAWQEGLGHRWAPSECRVGYIADYSSLPAAPRSAGAGPSAIDRYVVQAGPSDRGVVGPVIRAQ